MITKEEIIKTLKTCYDPEINVDVHTLGLIYDISINDKDVKIKMTLTTPFCPYGQFLIDQIKEKIIHNNKAKLVDIELTFDPPWQPSDELRSSLGI